MYIMRKKVSLIKQWFLYPYFQRNAIRFYVTFRWIFITKYYNIYVLFYHKIFLLLYRVSRCLCYSDACEFSVHVHLKCSCDDHKNARYAIRKQLWLSETHWNFKILFKKNNNEGKFLLRDDILKNVRISKIFPVEDRPMAYRAWWSR